MGKYFFIYIRIFLNLVLFLFISNIVYLSQIISFNYFYLIIIALLLTLSGLPPFFIFLLKIGFFLIVLFLILRSFISLFYYIRFRIYMFIYLNFKKFRIEINFSYIFG